MSGPIEIPADLSLSSTDELRRYETAIFAERDEIAANDTVTPEIIERLTQLEGDLTRVQAAIAGREAEAARAAEAQRLQLSEQRDRSLARMGAERDGEPREPAAIDAEAITAAAVQGAVAALVAAGGESGLDVAALTQRATASLSVAQREAPPVEVPSAQLAVTAGIDIPGVAAGSTLPTLDAVAHAVHQRAKSAPLTQMGSAAVDSGGQPALTIRNQYEHEVDDRTSLSQMRELIDYVTRPELAQSLVAGGGWCAPSETRYDFFNIACSTVRAIDLPTIGVTRGGIRVPVSPSLGDTVPTGVFGGFSTALAVTSNPWLWTETSDILTVTGSTNKPCVRIPCPDFTETRLECYGVCLTAGNLTDAAYPENTANFIRLLMSAHAHAINGRILALMQGLAGAAITTGEYAAADAPAFQQILGGTSLGAVDYRARYGMCADDVLEVVIPYWVRDVIRADLAWRTGVDLLSVSDAQIDGYFRDRNMRPQWVDDWQVRGTSQFGNATPMTAWPTTVDVLIYAAGTFVLGNGLELDLGVVRDSVLNSENDHTAAWSEECHLVAMVGHAARRYTITFQVMGATTVAQVTGGGSVDAFPNL